MGLPGTGPKYIMSSQRFYFKLFRTSKDYIIHTTRNVNVSRINLVSIKVTESAGLY